MALRMAESVWRVRMYGEWKKRTVSLPTSLRSFMPGLGLGVGVGVGVGLRLGLG